MEAETQVIKPLGNYSKIRVAAGFIYIAGTSARMASGDIAGVSTSSAGARHRDVQTQTRFILNAIARSLSSVGASLDDCLDLTVYLTNMDDFPLFNQAYGEFFTTAHPPTRTTVAVAALPHPDMVVEIKAMAYRPAI